MEEFMRHPPEWPRIEWTIEEMLSANSFVYSPQDMSNKGLRNGVDTFQYYSYSFQNYNDVWKEIFLYTPFEYLPLVRTDNIFSKKCIEWRLRYGK